MRFSSKARTVDANLQATIRLIGARVYASHASPSGPFTLNLPHMSQIQCYSVKAYSAANATTPLAPAAITRREPT